VGLGLLVLAWPVYDGLFRSPLGRSRAAGAFAFGLVVAIAYGLTRALSGRAAFLHVGAMLGTLMVANVWMRIIPAQRALVAAVREGRRPDAELARRAKERSKHNNYMTYPVLFVMISNHFPMTYGSPASWAILGCAFLVGAAIRHYQNVRDPSPSALLGALGFAALLAVATAFPRQGDEAEDTHVRAEPSPTSSDRTHTPSAATAPPSLASALTAPRDAEAAAVGTIKGVARLTGTPPRPRALAVPAECGRQGPKASEDVVAADGKLANVFVWIRGGLRGWKGAPPKDEVIIDQRGCVYSPRVVGVEVGQPVTFVNGDPIMHNVHVTSESNESFNLGLPGQGTRVTKRFSEPEVMITVKCDVHPWMRSYIGVSPHPFFAVTDDKGQYSLRDVPPGEYELEAWHEVYGRETRRVSLGAGGQASAEFSFAAP
jgi:plastocyanin